MAKISIQSDEQFAREYADSLIIEQLSEMDSVVKLGDLADRLSSHGLGLAAIKSLLASNPAVFSYHERRWVPAARVIGAGRPLAEIVRLVLTGFGIPTSLDALTREVSRSLKKDLDEVETSVLRLVKLDKQFVLDRQDRVSLALWTFAATDEPLDRALELNQVSLTEFEELTEKLKGLNWRSEGVYAEALKIAAPAKLKVLGAVAYRVLNGEDESRQVLMYDTQKIAEGFLSVKGYIAAPDGTITTEAEAKKLIVKAIKLAEKLAPTVDVEDAAPIEVKDADLARIVTKITGSGSTLTATKLLEEFYEITPSNKTYPDDLANLMDALKGDKSLQWVGGDRFRKFEAFPEYTATVPEPFKFVASGVMNEEDEPVDEELTDEGLSSSLRKLLGHPLATDVLDEDALPAPKTMPEQLRLVLKSIHRELGTFPLCQIPTAWLEAQPVMQELLLIDKTGKELKVWFNQETRLMYGFLDWWLEQSIESGAVFSLTKTTKPNVLEFEWMDQPDPVVYISNQRMEDLRQISETAEGRSTLDLIIDVMGHWPKGADYLTILAEVNVIRRSSRRLIASLLSSYQCFYQRSGSPVWHYDAKKLDQGFDKTKKKFIKK